MIKLFVFSQPQYDDLLSPLAVSLPLMGSYKSWAKCKPKEKVECRVKDL